MTTVHQKKLKEVTLLVAGQTWQCQTRECELQNNSDDPEQNFTLCPEGEYYEDTDPDFALVFTALADWRATGLSTYLWEHDGETAAFTYVVHPDAPTSAAHWTGEVKLKAPNAGGTARETETQQITLKVLGKPDFHRGVPA